MEEQSMDSLRFRIGKCNQILKADGFKETLEHAEVTHCSKMLKMICKMKQYWVIIAVEKLRKVIALTK